MSIYYDPSKAGQYVWAMMPKAYKPGQPTTYQLTNQPSPEKWEERGWVMAAPCQHGMFDDEGFYCTYRPPFGTFPGKYYRVLQGKYLEKVKLNYERDQTYIRHGHKPPSLEAVPTTAHMI